jgi:hypothetical protein
MVLHCIGRLDRANDRIAVAALASFNQTGSSGRLARNLVYRSISVEPHVDASVGGRKRKILNNGAAFAGVTYGRHNLEASRVRIFLGF